MSKLKHPESWPEPAGKPRVLIENPDGAELWAHADLLRQAGYEVATCYGPSWTACPLTDGGECPLAAGADVIVTTTELTDSAAIIEALETKVAGAVVVESQAGEAVDAATVIRQPVTQQSVLDAVETLLER